MDNNHPAFGLIAHTNIILSENDILNTYSRLFDTEAKNIFKFSASLRSILESNTLHPLQANSTYTLSLYITLRTVLIRDIIKFLDAKQSLKTGAYGLIIAYTHAQDILLQDNTHTIKPVTYQILSFDSANNQTNKSFLIPYLHSYAHDVHGFLMAKAEDGIASCVPPKIYFISITPLSNINSFSASI